VSYNNRLLSLDGLRGIAILAVLAFHYLSRFPEFYPYGNTFSAFGRHGSVGVQLFFIISGFVIALTLERSTSFLSFTIRRFARLWPPMLVCSLITFVVLALIDTPFTNFRRVGVQGFLPSLTFIGPEIWARLVDGAHWIDGAYWSLFVEVRFYFWAAVIYWIAPRHLGLTLWVLVLVAAGLHQLPGKASLVVDLLLFPSHIAYFAAGALFYELWIGRSGNWRWPALVILAAYSATIVYLAHPAPALVILILMSFAGFVALILRPSLLRLVAAAPLIWVGRRSYSLYLLHQNIGVAMITVAPIGLSSSSYILVILTVTLLMLCLAHAIFELVERRSHSIANTVFASLRSAH
jgi:peptidoglycan/LPS O-acetylase OafA/YrhL